MTGTDFGQSGNKLLAELTALPDEARLDAFRRAFAEGFDANTAGSIAGNEHAIAVPFLAYFISEECFEEWTGDDEDHTNFWAYIRKLVALFLANGFDASREHGVFGASVLKAVLRYRQRIVGMHDVVGDLLKAGADPFVTTSVFEGDEPSCSAYDDAEEAASVSWRHYEYDRAAGFKAVRHMFEKVRTGGNFRAVEPLRSLIGKRMDSVFPVGHSAIRYDGEKADMYLRASVVPGSAASVVVACEDSAICIDEVGYYYCDRDALALKPAERPRVLPAGSVIRKIENFKIHCENGFVLEVDKETVACDAQTRRVKLHFSQPFMPKNADSV